MSRGGELRNEGAQGEPRQPGIRVSARDCITVTLSSLISDSRACRTRVEVISRFSARTERVEQPAPCCSLLHAYALLHRWWNVRWLRVPRACRALCRFETTEPAHTNSQPRSQLASQFKRLGLEMYSARALSPAASPAHPRSRVRAEMYESVRACEWRASANVLDCRARVANGSWSVETLSLKVQKVKGQRERRATLDTKGEYTFCRGLYPTRGKSAAPLSHF